MSNYKAISVVTAALRNRLSALCGGVLSGATVSTLRPDVSGAGLPTLGANIFLYQVTPNAALRNQDLPTRRADGSVIKHPVAALDLHFLLSFYGNDANFETQLLLGLVVGNLHAEPSLSRDEIEQVFSASALGLASAGGSSTQGDQTITEIAGPNPQALLDPSGLADAIDLVRFTPTNLSLEELSKLWSVCLDTPYVLSVTYQAGPVLIEDTSAQLTSAALPVMLLPRIHTLAAVQPSIAQVVPATGPGKPIVSSSTLTLNGTFYPGVSTTLYIDGVSAQQLTLPQASSSQPQQPQSTITGVPIPSTVLAGAHSIQVAQQLPVQQTGGTTQTVYSNSAGFVLQPTFVSNSITASDPTRSITVVVAPAVAAHQTVRLLLNLLNPPAGSAIGSGQYVLETTAPQADGTTSFVFATKGLTTGDIPTGSYLARIQIDGVDSQLNFVAPPASGTATGPTGFTDPTATVVLQ